MMTNENEIRTVFKKGAKRFAEMCNSDIFHLCSIPIKEARGQTDSATQIGVGRAERGGISYERMSKICTTSWLEQILSSYQQSLADHNI